MLRLGRVISNHRSEIVTIYKFSLDHMQWSAKPLEVEFVIETDKFASGGFRDAYKATSLTQGFTNKSWVIKKYRENTLNDIETTGQLPEEHTRKAVQSHFLAMNMAMQLEKIVKASDELASQYGQTFSYGIIYMGKTDIDEYITIEEYVEGVFIKYINNNGKLCGDDSDVRKKAESLVHFTHDKSKGRVMLLDIQGAGYKLYDPEFASRDIQDDKGNVTFCTGNWSMEAINEFFSVHKCNKYCTLLELKVKDAPVS